MNEVIGKARIAIEALQNSAAVTEHACKGIAVLDDGGRICFADMFWAEMHGYETGDELVGKRIDEFHSAEQMQKDVVQFMAEAKFRGRLAGPLNHIDRNRSEFATHTEMTAIETEDGRTIGLIISSIKHCAGVEQIIEPGRSQTHLKELTAQLTDLEDQLRDQALDRQQARDACTQRDELRIANEKLQNNLAENRQIKEQLEQQVGELIETLGESDNQAAELNELKEQLHNQACEQERISEQLQQYRKKLEQAEALGISLVRPFFLLTHTHNTLIKVP